MSIRTPDGPLVLERPLLHDAGQNRRQLKILSQRPRIGETERLPVGSVPHAGRGGFRGE